jgi:ribosomal protein S8
MSITEYLGQASSELVREFVAKLNGEGLIVPITAIEQLHEQSLVRLELAYHQGRIDQIVAIPFEASTTEPFCTPPY